MKNLQRYFLLLIGALAASGCNKYLDVEPKGYTLLQSVTHYDQWLNTSSLSADVSAGNTRLLSDCVDNPTIQPGTSVTTDLIYLWAPQFTLSLSAIAPFWTELYGQIYYFNTLLNGIDKASGGSEQLKASLKAEALLGRAYCYFTLTNLYGKPYDPATADADLSVPFVTSNDVGAESIPPRSTIKQMYDQIFADIQAALPNLPASNAQNHFRGSVAAAYSVLARIYFYRRDYAEAARNARLALSSDASLKMLDYNAYPAVLRPALPNQGVTPDAIYSRNITGDITPTVDFLRSFDPSDLRLRFFYFSVINNTSQPSFNYAYSTTTRGGARYAGSGSSTTASYYYNHNSGTTVAEMKLIIAEEAARRGDLSTALPQLNDVLKCRLPAATFVPFSTTDATLALEQILLERNRELALNGGLRWFDMRRLDAEGKMPEVNRYSAGNGIIATLPQHSPRYVLQIPDRVLYYNPGMAQNP